MSKGIVKNYGKSIRIRLRLLNIAKSENIYYQTVLTRYFQERLIYRISQTSYRQNFYLKGGALMYAHEKFAARPTLDIDFLGNNISNNGVISHDRTKFSLNGAPATSKRQFVLDVVKAYVEKHPEKTFDELKRVFHPGLCSPGFKCIGMICSEEEHAAWNNKYKNKRYSIGQPDGTLRSADGINFYVNTQWAIDGMKGILKLAKAEGFKVSTISKAPQPGLFE